jgi:hypothetical protein
MQLYDELKAAKLPIRNHYSDLYVPVTAESTRILLKYPLHFKNATRFIDAVDGTLCYDLPFCFLPYWTAVSLIAQSDNYHGQKITHS